MLSLFFEYLYTAITAFLLFFFLRRSFLKKETVKRHIQEWILFGIIFNLFSLSFLYTVYPLSWIDPGISQFLGITLLHIILSVVSGVSFALVGYFFLKESKLPSHFKPFIFGVSLALSEILRSLLLSLLFYGNGETAGLHWSSGTIGNGLSTTPFIEYAYFGGVYLLTFIFGYICYIFVSKKHLQLYYKHFIVLFFLLVIIHYGIKTKGPETPISVAVITTNFQEPTIRNKETLLTYFLESTIKLHETTKKLSTHPPRIIIYPEDANYIPLLNKEKRSELLPYFKDTIFIDGSTKNKNGMYSNTTLFYTPLLNKEVRRTKSFLMPFNEYVPNLFETLFTFFVSGETLKKYKETHTYTLEKTMKVFDTGTLKIGTIICSEILSFETIRTLQKEGADIVFYQTHLNVFHNNPWFIMHMRSFSKITAAQLRTPLLGASNNSPSFVISPYGKIIDETETGFYTKEYIVKKDTIIKREY